MEISNNENLYTNFYKNIKKEKSDILPIEIFKIDEKNIVRNSNLEKYYNNEEKNIDSGIINNWISYNTKFDNITNEWTNQMKTATFGNVYEDAKDFEDFVNNWIEKGYSESEALERANFYAMAGLLDYGKQKAIAIYNRELGYDDKKQHGFHLIDNPPLKKAILDTLDSLDTGSVADLVSNLFLNYPSKTTTSFEDLLNQYGVKLEDLNEKQLEEEQSKFTFTGNININDKMSLEYQNFIFDTLIGFFKDRINSIREYKENIEKTTNSSLDNIQNSYDILIENFKRNTKEYNKDKNILDEYMKNNKANICDIEGSLIRKY